MSIEKTSLLYTPPSRPGASATAGGQNGPAAPGADFLSLLFSLQPGMGTPAAKTRADGNADGDQSGDQSAALSAQTMLASTSYAPETVIDPALLAIPGDGMKLQAPSYDRDGMEILRDAVAAALNGETMPEIAEKMGAALKTTLPPAEMVRRQKEMMGFLQHLLSGLPADDRMMAINIDPDFRISQDGPGAEAAPSLIATGMTPEELTQFMEDLAKNMPQAENLMAGTVRIRAPAEKTEALFAPRAMVRMPAQPLAAAAGATEQDMEAKLNALLSAEAGESGEDIDGADGESGFERILKTLEGAQNKAAAGTGADTARGPVSHAGAQLSTFSAKTLPLTGLSFPSSLSGQIYPDGMGWENFAAGVPGTGTALTGPGALTSLIGHAPAAAQPHPATQAVAASIARTASGGETKDITVKLDPPELGRVEIRLQFGKDRNMKAHLVVEKPETYMMLQRDAQILERSLHEAGMSMEGGGVSLELADDGGLSGERHGRGNDSGSSAGRDDAGEDIMIETRMDWYVDPDTGMTRYDLMA